MAKVDSDKLDAVSVTFVKELGEVNLFRYNKFSYLFEYFFIKNFGKRYTKEQFVKFPHGPVISNYKSRIKTLRSKGLLHVDLTDLERSRKVDDSQFDSVIITPAERSSEVQIDARIVRGLISAIVNKFGDLSCKKLEEFVYSTGPMIHFKSQAARGFKKDPGSYILVTDCIKLADYHSDKSETRRLIFEHQIKEPLVDHEQLVKDAKDLAYFSALRPVIKTHDRLEEIA